MKGACAAGGQLELVGSPMRPVLESLADGWGCADSPVTRL